MDPGAVPGASTNFHQRWDRQTVLRGRNRIDMRGKGIVFARYGTTVIGPNTLNANDNEAYAVAA